MFFFVGVLSTEQKKSLNQHNWIRDEGEGKFVFQTKSSIHHSVCFASFVVVREKKASQRDRRNLLQIYYIMIYGILSGGVKRTKAMLFFCPVKRKPVAILVDEQAQ